MQEAVVRLYGPTAAGQVSEARLSSYTFDDLTVMLNTPDLDTMVSNINRSTWVVFLLSDSSLGQPDLISRFLSERQDLLREKRVILFSLTAPYYFDATDISKLSAYYALYSKQPAFVDVAARLLFQQISLQGASTVSIPAVGYDLITQTQPDAAQIIPLALDQEIPPTPTSGATFTPTTKTAEPTKIPLYRIGDTIAIRAGPILDHNQHIVPDGTVVNFTMSTLDEGGGILQQVDATTVGGKIGR